MIKTFKIIEKKNLWFAFSATLILLTIFLSMFRLSQSKALFNFGIDFLGGNMMILKFPALDDRLKNEKVSSKAIEKVFIHEMREVFQQGGYDKVAIRMSHEHEVMIKTLALPLSDREILLDLLRKRFGGIDILEVDYIGPSIGKSLQKSAITLVLLVSIFLLIYISFRFRLSYGLAALIALLHDALIIFSCAALFSLEINLAFVAALLTVLGYSINDTIVVFDRIRENRSQNPGQSLIDLINLSLSQTLTRTLNTSMTTFFVVISLLLFGGITIKVFSLVLLIGIIAGTYSSLCIASPFLFVFLRQEEVKIL